MVKLIERGESKARLIAAFAAVAVVAALMVLMPKNAFATPYAYFTPSTGTLMFTNTSDAHTNGSTDAAGNTWYTIPSAATGSASGDAAGWVRNRSQIRTIDFDDTCATTPIQPEDLRSYFTMMPNLTEIDHLDRLDGTHAASATFLFASDPSLTTINGLNSLKLTNASDTIAMFYNDAALTSIDLSNWDLPNATSIADMFQGCTGLTSVNMNGFNVPQLATINNLFSGCTALTTVDLRSVDVQHVGSFANLFDGCTALTSVNVDGWDTSSAISFDNAFRNCSALESLSLSGWSATNAPLNSMFEGCSNLVSLNISSLSTSNTQTKTNMFNGCTSLRLVHLPAQWTFQGPTAETSCVLPDAPTTPSLIDPTLNYTGKWAETEEHSSTQETAAALAADYTPYTGEPHIWLWGSNTNFYLHYEANGGTDAPSQDASKTNIDPSDVAGQYWVITNAQPTRDGYTFAGWNTADDGTGTSYAAGDHMPLPTDAPVATLYAQWNEIPAPDGDGEDAGSDGAPSGTGEAGAPSAEGDQPQGAIQVSVAGEQGPDGQLGDAAAAQAEQSNALAQTADALTGVVPAIVLVLAGAAGAIAYAARKHA